MHDVSVISLREAYQQGHTTPLDMVLTCRRRILDDIDGNAWIHVLDESALRQYVAALATLDPQTHPLWGIPFAIKDNIDLAGVATTAACPAFAYVPSRSASVVERLIAAGAIPMGKTNLDQFATGLVGTRSPYGEVPNWTHPAHVSGGSSSGSARAVAAGQVCFALGTDTAGSGRVPAAFNGLVGWKPTRGIVSTAGVVPACASLDCVSLFTRSIDDWARIMPVMIGEDDLDPDSRAWRPRLADTVWPATLGIPDTLEFFGDTAYAACFEAEVEAWRERGCRVVRIDARPFLEAARLLYEGPWVAERYLTVGPLLKQDPEAVLPVIREIIGPSASQTAAAAFDAFRRLAALSRRAHAVLSSVDAALFPTAPTCPTRAAVRADPIGVNSRLGTYTNFMNLLDLSAVALPAGTTPAGIPFGVTLCAAAHRDRHLWELARGRHADLATGPCGEGWIPVAVCGAHLTGMPLNHQLTSRRAVLLESIRSAPQYRLYALAGGPPARPGMVRVHEGGVSVAMEVWAVPADQFGSFVAGIPAPLGIGKVMLQDGRWVSGFICETAGLEGAVDISVLGDWRLYVSGT